MNFTDWCAEFVLKSVLSLITGTGLPASVYLSVFMVRVTLELEDIARLLKSVQACPAQYCDSSTVSYAFQNIASNSLSLMLFTKFLVRKFAVSKFYTPFIMQCNLLCLHKYFIFVVITMCSFKIYFKLELCNDWNTTLQVIFIVAP